MPRGRLIRRKAQKDPDTVRIRQCGYGFRHVVEQLTAFMVRAARGLRSGHRLLSFLNRVSSIGFPQSGFFSRASSIGFDGPRREWVTAGRRETSAEERA